MNFEEWFNENYGDMFFTNIAEESVFKNGLKSAWQAALQSQWQPIETASESRILVYVEEGFIEVVTFDGTAFYDDIGDEIYGLTPIYWQPLPPLPLGV